MVELILNSVEPIGSAATEGAGEIVLVGEEESTGGVGGESGAANDRRRG